MQDKGPQELNHLPCYHCFLCHSERFCWLSFWIPKPPSPGNPETLKCTHHEAANCRLTAPLLLTYPSRPFQQLPYPEMMIGTYPKKHSINSAHVSQRRDIEIISNLWDPGFVPLLCPRRRSRTSRYWMRRDWGPS